MVKLGSILHYNLQRAEGVVEGAGFLMPVEVEVVVQGYRLVVEAVEELRRLVAAAVAAEQPVDNIDSKQHSFDILHMHYRGRFHNIGHIERYNPAEHQLLAIGLSRELSVQVYS